MSDEITMKNVTSILRGVSYAGLQDANKSGETKIPDLASEYNEYVDSDKPTIVTELNSFTKNFSGFEEDRLCSTIEREDCKGADNELKIYNSGDFFNSYFGQQVFDFNESVNQYDIYSQENNKYGGVKYINDNQDEYDAALEFAKADIRAIGKSFEFSQMGAGTQCDDVLEPKEIASYLSYSDNTVHEITQTLKAMDLDGKTYELSAEEYASYMLAIDYVTRDIDAPIAGLGADPIEGIITKEDKETAENFSLDTIRAIADSFYSYYQENN